MLAVVLVVSHQWMAYENFASLITRNISDIVTMNCFLCRCLLGQKFLKIKGKTF